MERSLTDCKNWLARLVAFDTTSRNTNLPLIDEVEPYLRSLGFRTVRVPGDEAGKANLYASIGPETEGGVILSGHTDVVPVDGQDWSSDPFTLVERDGRLFGRGACDMKGFLACCLAAAPEMAAAELKRPIRFAFSYDEEIGMFGAPFLAEAMARDLPANEACLIGEPTMMRVVDGHKGIGRFRTTIHGKEAHSSQYGQGVSAVALAGRALTALERLQAELIAEADPDNGFDPPFTTITANVISGGTAFNIMARECVFEWDCRACPGADAEAVLNRFAVALGDAFEEVGAGRPEIGFETDASVSVPPLAPRPNNRARELAFALTGSNATEKVAYAAEGGIFQQAGMDTVVIGPGSIAQAHQPDEFVAIDQLSACLAFMDRLAERLST